MCMGPSLFETPRGLFATDPEGASGGVLASVRDIHILLQALVTAVTRGRHVSFPVVPMSSDHPSSDGPTLLAPAAPAEPVPVPPAVGAVVVTPAPGPWLEETLRSLTSSDYPSLAIFVLDAGSVEDPTPRVAAVAPHAFVRRLPDNVGFAAAANEAMAS